MAPVGRPRIALHYVHGDDIGFGRVGAALAHALRERDVDVDDTTRPEAAERPPPIAVWLAAPYHITASWTGQRTVLITMWETDRLPGSFVAALGRASTVLVPSTENAALFAEHHPDVHLMPFGVDAARWSWTLRRPPDSELCVLVAGSGPRKGIDLAHAAFRLAFPDPSRLRPRRRLVIKGGRNEHYAGDDVEVIGGVLSSADERALYDRAHCYLQPSRGEGFGLQPLQAIAMGIPTVLTDAHGHRAFAHLGVPVAARRVPADLFAFGECGGWWEPAPAALATALRAVHTDYPRAVAAARASSVRAARELGWDRAADALCDVLWGGRGVVDALPSSARWTPRAERQYRAVTRRDLTIAVAGGEHVFVAGEEAVAPAHVKRHAPLRRLLPDEVAALPAGRRAEYEDWVTEVRRLPPRLAAAARRSRHRLDSGQLAAHRLDEPAGDGEADAAAGGLVADEPLERLEDEVAVGGRDAGPGVDGAHVDATAASDGSL
jgi:glycosyltransferase involved in cell wall biosynthesis